MMIFLFAFTFYFSIVRFIAHANIFNTEYATVGSAFGLKDYTIGILIDTIVLWGSWGYQIIIWGKYINII